MDEAEQPADPVRTPLAEMTARRRRRRRWLIGGAALVALLTVVAVAVARLQPQVKAVPASDTTVLSVGNLRNSVSATGTVASANSFKVYSNQAYAVRHIYVEVGQSVAVGDRLLDLDTATLDKQVASKTAAMDQAAGTSAAAVNAARDKYDLARKALSDGTNAGIVNATSAVTNALNAWEKAQQAADAYADTLDSDQNTQVLTLKSALDNAENALATAQYSARKAASDLDAAKAPLTSARQAYDAAKAAVATAASADALATAKANLDAAQKAYDALADVSRRADLALNSAETVRDNADAQYEAALAGADTTLADLEKTADAAQDTYTNAQAALDAAEASANTEIQLALDALRSSEASASNGVALQDLANLTQDLSATTVTAPVAGTVTAVYANVGANAAGLVFLIEDTTRLVIDSSVKEFDVVSVKPGMPVTIQSDATRDAVYEGRIASIAPASGKDATGKTITGSDIQYATKVDVVPLDTKLHIGMNVRLNYVLAEQNGVFAVPLDAVYTSPKAGSAVLAAVKDARGATVLQEFAVTTGLSNDLSVAISGRGIEEGLRVINAPTKYTAGATVTVAG